MSSFLGGRFLGGLGARSGFFLSCCCFFGKSGFSAVSSHTFAVAFWRCCGFSVLCEKFVGLYLMVLAVDFFSKTFFARLWHGFW